MEKVVRVNIPSVLLIIVIVILSLLQVSTVTGGAMKPEIIEGNDQIGPPWYDSAWHYRCPVIINNNGNELLYYQVLIRLDQYHFNFNHADANGSDIRVADSDGTSELKFWIESWDKDNQLAYLWVRISRLGNGYSTIYIYYNNPDANSASDGTATFDNFDDEWNDFNSEEKYLRQDIQSLLNNNYINYPFTWTPIGSPIASEGILNLAPGSGIKSTTTYLHQAVGMRANFGLGNGYEWGGFINGDTGDQTIIRDLPSDPDNLYLQNIHTESENIILPRAHGDWHNALHVYEIRWKDGQSVGDIDHGTSVVTSTLSTSIPNTNLPVTLYSDTLAGATMKVDWVYARQYRFPEPTTTVNPEQRLVALSINGIDSPDPIRRGLELTYQLTISNTSMINAPDVVMTDTLPGSVEFISVNFSQGSCVYESEVLCDLGYIGSNSQANVTIVVSATIEGMITNTAIVASPNSEMNLGDNTSVQMTLVDWTPPVVNWEKPVSSGGTYYTFGGMVNLEASATDLGGVAWVEYKYYDHVHGQGLVTIGQAYSYPYEVTFDTSDLEITSPLHPYQTMVIGVDRAGNESDYGNPFQVIYILRREAIYLPVIRR